MPRRKTPPARPRIRRSPEEARALILDAAESVIEQHGPDRTGLKEIAAAADVSHALITHYFGSIDALIEQVLERHMTGLRERILTRLTESQTTWEQILDLVFAELGDPGRGRLLAWALLSGRSARTDFYARKNLGMRQIADHLARSIGCPEERREELELRIMIVTCAALGYAAGGEVLWRAFGRRPSEALSRRFRVLLSTLGRSSAAGYSFDRSR